MESQRYLWPNMAQATLSVVPDPSSFRSQTTFCFSTTTTSKIQNRFEKLPTQLSKASKMPKKYYFWLKKEIFQKQHCKLFWLLFGHHNQVCLLVINRIADKRLNLLQLLWHSNRWILNNFKCCCKNMESYDSKVLLIRF